MQAFIRLLICTWLLLSGGAVYSQAATDTCTLAAKKMVVDTGVISYLDGGTGPSILLIHGLFAQKEQWLAVGCALASKGYRIVALDLPGYGASTGYLVSVYPLESQVNILHQFLSALKLKQIHIAGSSMGGAIASMYATQYPKEIESLAFIGSPLGIIPWGPQVRSAIFQGVNPFIPINQNQFELEMSLLFFKPPVVDLKVSSQIIKDYQDNNRHYQQVWDIVNFYDTTLEHGAVYQGATLILWGEKDSIFDIAGLPALKKRFPHSHSFSFPDAAHLLMLEEPKKVVAVYSDFLGQRKSFLPKK